ncbi:hypothetical protein [Chryseobacterium oryctis]|uniref:Uncharacterized protein n=1 Tax=Chryseobacterium oryctis TaxID=2952618 RepID=A0ABT3HL66_9FLAO|nr:hypothetical protein [Chryseobacterium oryctis]MCW3160524.1 hypothetical protein [Chryseobacterium oryctis]
MSSIKALGIPKIKVLSLGDNNLNKIEKDFDDTILTVSFKEEPDIEVGKKSLIQFLISGNSRWGNNDLTIELINENKELSFTTLKWSSVDYGFTMKTNITSKKAGKFTVNFKANDKYINSLTLEAKYKTLENPKLVKDTKVNYSDEQKAQMIATVYGESSRDENLCVNIPWIYYNLTKKLGFEKGMNRSSFYKDRNKNKWITESYKACMFYLGKGNQFADDKMADGKTKVKDFCKDTNKNFRIYYKPYIDLIRNYFDQHIFNANEIMNPFYNWEGQGYWKDMNIRMYNYSIKWAKASQYFHLQKRGYVKTMFVKEIIAKDPARNYLDVTTYLCDDVSIEKYFKDNPTQLPKFEEGKCSAGGNKLLCNINEKNAIPGVHFDK